MKKTALLFTLIISAVLFTACGGKQTENVQTQAAAPSQSQGGPANDAVEESKPAVSVVDLPEDFEPQYFEGTVTAIEGAVITVADDSSSMLFDISRNDASEDYPVVRGCYVEVSYADAPMDSIYPSDNVSVINDNEELAETENRDPVIYGTLQYLDTNELSMIDDAGRSIDFDPIIVRTVSFSGFQGGEDVAITYCGSIDNGGDDDNGTGAFNNLPVAIKIVSTDAAKSEDAEANYIDGIVSSIDGASMRLATEIADFEFECEESMLDGIESDAPVRVFYSGPLSGITVTAERIEKR